MKQRLLQFFLDVLGKYAADVGHFVKVSKLNIWQQIRTNNHSILQYHKSLKQISEFI